MARRQAHGHESRRMAVSEGPLVPLAETVHERSSVEIFRGCTRGCRFCQAGMITRPVRERSIETVGQIVANGLAATGSTRWDSSASQVRTTPRSHRSPSSSRIATGNEYVVVVAVDPGGRLQHRTRERTHSRRSPIGFDLCPEGGSERIRRVINKTVSKDDLIRTVTAAYSSGWRQVKLYFMCGLPTETDDDVLEIADLAREVIRSGREASGRRDIRCTVSIGGFVPKPHTPFQWAAQLGWEETDERLAKLRNAIPR